MRIATYFSVFKLWFTLRASANAVAPSEVILFCLRLWKKVLYSPSIYGKMLLLFAILDALT